MKVSRVASWINSPVWKCFSFIYCWAMKTGKICMETGVGWMWTLAVLKYFCWSEIPLSPNWCDLVEDSVLRDLRTDAGSLMKLIEFFDVKKCIANIILCNQLRSFVNSLVLGTVNSARINGSVFHWYLLKFLCTCPRFSFVWLVEVLPLHFSLQVTYTRVSAILKLKVFIDHVTSPQIVPSKA